MPKTAAPIPYTHPDGTRRKKDGKLGWRLRPTDPKNGRQVNRVFYGSEREAQRALDDWRRELEGRVAAVVPGSRFLTVDEWAAEWLEQYKWKVPPANGQPGVRRRFPTWANARAVLKAYVVPALGPDTRLATLTYQDCKDAIAGLMLAKKVDDKGRPLPASARTKATAASIMRLMLRDAVRAGVTTSDPAASLQTKWGAASSARETIPSIQEVERLAIEMDKLTHGTFGDIVRVLGYTGLRMEELAGAKIGALDLEKRSLWIGDTATESGGRRTVVDDVKTGASVRYVVVLEQAVEPLQRILAYSEKKGSTQLVCGARGGYLSYGHWRRKLAIGRANSGVDYSAHALRHTCATLLISSGASIEQVRQQLGHSSEAVTRGVYIHALELDRRALSKALSAKVTGLIAENESS